ncbi:MAG: hypothetical protein AB7G39_18800, partial [Alphaproteobacteria bacterium]
MTGPARTGATSIEEQTSIRAHLFSLALAGVFLVAAPAVQAQEDQRFILRQTVAPAIDPAIMSSRPMAYRLDEEPEWLGRVIEKLGANKPPTYEMRQRVLFRRNGEASFLAVIWAQPSQDKMYFELHQVTVVTPTNVRLTWRSGLEARNLSIVEPSGQNVHKDDLPILYLAASEKESGFAKEELHVILLDRASVRLMTREPVRPVRAMDLDGDGRYALIASDDRWGSLFEECLLCGPLVPLLYTWNRTEYRSDCRWYPDYFEQRAKLLERRIAAAPDLTLPTYLGLRMEMVLGLLQGGRMEDAEKVFAETEAALHGPLAQRWAKPEIDRYWAFVSGTFKPVVEAAMAHSDDACPVLGYTGPGRPV